MLWNRSDWQIVVSQFWWWVEEGQVPDAAQATEILGFDVLPAQIGKRSLAVCL